MHINPACPLAPLYLSKGTTHYSIIQLGIPQEHYLLLIQIYLLAGFAHSTFHSSCHSRLDCQRFQVNIIYGRDQWFSILLVSGPFYTPKN